MFYNFAFYFEYGSYGNKTYASVFWLLVFVEIILTLQ